jgi:hypothetical protein
VPEAHLRELAEDSPLKPTRSGERPIEARVESTTLSRDVLRNLTQHRQPIVAFELDTLSKRLLETSLEGAERVRAELDGEQTARTRDGTKPPEPRRNDAVAVRARAHQGRTT